MRKTVGAKMCLGNDVCVCVCVCVCVYVCVCVCVWRGVEFAVLGENFF